MATFKLTLRTPDTVLYEKEVTSVAFGSEGGDAQIFAHHASLTASIAFSTLKIAENGTEEYFLVRNGLLAFDNDTNEALILAIHAEEKSRVNHQTAKEYLKFIEEQLAQGHDLSEFQITHLEGEKFAIEQQLETLERD